MSDLGKIRFGQWFLDLNIKILAKFFFFLNPEVIKIYKSSSLMISILYSTLKHRYNIVFIRSSSYKAAKHLQGKLRKFTLKATLFFSSAKKKMYLSVSELGYNCLLERAPLPLAILP